MVCNIQKRVSSIGICTACNRHIEKLKHYVSVADSISIFRQEAPNTDSAIASLDVLVIREG